MRDVIANGTKKIAKRIISPKSKDGSKFLKREEFWALRNVFFEVNEGDRIGIIGKNGAGKTTILKLLSRITEPSEGRILIKGRVASLLEVGTGFHPELTGRENIFLNGAVLGMGRSEIKMKFDEIVDFAGVEKFLDTPVKRYSSGMYVRLAFSVAAHLEPEILIVDEVLAVGDAQFQKKSLGKMEDVSREGRTVIFVSHNMGAVEQLCSRGILLDDGKIVTDGDVNDTIKNYLKNAMTDYRGKELERRIDRHGSGRIKVMKFRVLDSGRNEVKTLKSGKEYYFEMQYFNSSEKEFDDVVLSLDVFDDRSNRILLFRTNFTNENIRIKAGQGKILCKVKNFPLANGVYSISIFMSKNQEVFDYIKEAVFINVSGGDFFGTGSQGIPTHCKILKKVEWYLE